MPKEKSIELIDSLMDSISSQLINLPVDLDLLWDETPYGGPVFYKVTFLCDSMLRVYELLQDYQINKYWKDDASRLEKDELNLGTLLQANQLTREARNEKMKRAFGGDKGEPLLKSVQDLNALGCFHAERISINTRLDECYTLLANKLIELYRAEHPEQKSLDMLKAKQIEPAGKFSDMEEYYSEVMLFFLNVANDLLYDFDASMDVYDNLEIFMSTVNCFSFQLDGSLKNYILKHNDELVQNPELREKYKQEDQFLHRESRKTLNRLTEFREKIAREYDHGLMTYKKYEHQFQKDRRKRIKEKVEDAKRSMEYFEIFYYTYLAFYHFLEAIVNGRDIRTCMEEDFMMNKLVHTDFKMMLHELL